MKRNDIIKKLINEGFSEKTLVNFTDKQLTSLAERMLNEETVMISKSSPNFQKDVDSAKKSKKTIETYEEKEVCEKCGENVCECMESDIKEELKGGQKKLDKNHNGKIDAQDFKILKGQKKSEVKEGNKIPVTKKIKNFNKNGKLSLTLRKINEFSDAQDWVENIVENNYHSLTTKNEIMNLIKSKLTESDVMENQPSTKPTPSTNPTPTIDPSRPKPQKPKRENPFEPGRQPKPKAKTKLPEFMKFDNIGIQLKDSK